MDYFASFNPLHNVHIDSWHTVGFPSRTLQLPRQEDCSNSRRHFTGLAYCGDWPFGLRFYIPQRPSGGSGALFTIPGVAIGQFILALPIVVSLTASAIEGIDPKIYLTLRTLGASDMQAALSSMWEGRYAITAAAVTAYSRVISEVGVSMMIGGNIKWHTRTITTAIALETGKGEFSMGIALGIVLLAFALTANTLVSSLRRRA